MKAVWPRVMAQIVLAATAGIARADGARSFPVHDLMPGFWAFWEAARSEPPDKQLMDWTRLYYEPNRGLLSPLPCESLSDPERLRTAFGRIPGDEAAMHLIADKVPTTLPEAETRFLKAFPDMQWHGDVYVLYTAGCFDGKPATIQGRPSLLFGVDVIAGAGETDIVPLMQHELFHLYHQSFFPEVDQAELWQPLWMEGLAVYTAKTLNPNTSNTNLLIKDDLIAAVGAKKSALATDFLRRFDSVQDSDTALYFLGGTHSAEIPSRSGYVLGLLVVEAIVSNTAPSIREMAHWRPQQAKPRIRAALESMVKK
jgi:hypothetical protein